MTVGAPPRPPRRRDSATRAPHPRDPVDRTEPEALIEEARRRARRRRWRLSAAIVAVVTGVGLLAVAVLGRGATPGGVSLAGSPSGVPADERPSTLVAQFSEMHVGWVLVYADGRVIVYDDCGPTSACVSDTPLRWHPFERRLTRAGVDLVRSGEVEPSVFLQDAAPTLPAGAWSDSERRTYDPSKYAVCYWEDNRLNAATRVVDRLPAAARALLHGKERTYDIDLFLVDRESAVECSEVTDDEARTLRGVLEAHGIRASSSGDGYTLGFDVPVDEAGRPGQTIGSFIAQILPHGEWVSWGG